ncbi:MAG TPA: thioredoxin domain-containing protein [Spirochaetia bacterium]|nr:thioredoxin domain-containing protein [Spirochaetia bacterium]
MGNNLDFGRNNLDTSLSPYLRQHADNPVFWQEWTPAVLQYARQSGKIVLASVGYSTCHWCHVMASEAFSDPDCARLLNEHFVAIKVDREQRPDIDRYLMGFLVATTGQGGWPMNVFLSPEGLGENDVPRPFFAMTYAAVTPRFGMPGFLEILQRIRSFYDDNRGEFAPFASGLINPVPLSDTRQSVAETAGPDIPPGDESFPAIADSYLPNFDAEWGGFGSGSKFPPHCTLLFLTYLGSTALGDARRRHELDVVVRTTLDRMMRRGLHDHLQGGFFRYCVDRQWSVPHFEKMLYDQALMLWTYSAAYARFGEKRYADTAHGIIRCLNETFRSGDLLISAHDADTGHHEGATYLWTVAELRSSLTATEFDSLSRFFEVADAGNFEGRVHLIIRGESEDYATAGRIAETFEPIRRKLLTIRRARPQPLADRKIVTSWNCLAAVALVVAYRCLGYPPALLQAKAMLRAIQRLHFADGRLHHSSIDGSLQPEEYLEDDASLLLLLTTVHQETGEGTEEISLFRGRVEAHRSGDQWVEAAHADFVPVAAERFDHPTPSSASLAERSLLESAIISGELYSPRPFADPLVSDFGNLTTLLQNGHFYTITTPDPVAWNSLPINAFQIPGRPQNSCYRGICTPGIVIQPNT